MRDYASRWGIEPLISDYQRREFDLAATQLRAPDRLDRLLLSMALALHWCVHVGQEDARHHPTPLEKTQEQIDPDHWTFKKLARSALSSFKRGLRVLLRRLQMQQPLTTLLSPLLGHEELIGGEV